MGADSKKNPKAKVQKPLSDKVNFFNSIAAKIMLLVGVCIVITVSTCTAVLVTNAKKEISDITMKYMLRVATSERDMLNQKFTGAASTALYASILADVKMEGVDSSYVYLVSRDGNMIYHPDESKIAKPVENEVVKGLVARIAVGDIPEDNVTRYYYKGAYKYASYALCYNNKILVFTADEDDVMKSMDSIRNVGILVAVVMALFSILAAFIVSKLIVAPIKGLTDIIDKTSKFNFKHNPNTKKLVNRRDEIGVMARAVGGMRASLRRMVGDIESASNKIDGNVDMLQEVTDVVNSMCTDNSATTEELAAGMQETAATAESIYANIGYMQTGARDITQLSENGDVLSNEVMDRAVALKEKTLAATKRTQEKYESVRERSDKAIEDSRAVDKINELTEAIMSISSRTSLLALNASIEAARAGEAGRGFAVVANEIGNLADQTSTAVGNINGIVSEVNLAVNNMSECLAETSEFLETTVLTDYAEFAEVSEQYSDDAAKFKDSMNDVHESILNLADSISKISDAISGINSTIGESTLGVTDIAEKTTDMVTRTSETNTLVDESKGCVEQLKLIVGEFEME